MARWSRSNLITWTKNRSSTTVSCNRWPLHAKPFQRTVSITIYLTKKINRVFTSNFNGRITGDDCISPICFTSYWKLWYVFVLQFLYNFNDKHMFPLVYRVTRKKLIFRLTISRISLSWITEHSRKREERRVVSKKFSIPFSKCFQRVFLHVYHVFSTCFPRVFRFFYCLFSTQNVPLFWTHCIIFFCVTTHVNNINSFVFV